MPTARSPLARSPRTRPTSTRALSLAALVFTLIGAPSAALACGGHPGFSLDLFAFLVVPALVVGYGQVTARRFVSGRHHSTARSLAALLGLALAAFGLLFGLAFTFGAPVLGVPLVVVELAYLVDVLTMWVAPRRPPLVAI